MNSLAVFLLSHDVTSTERLRAKEALRHRGFETFAERSFKPEAYNGLSNAFSNGAHALIAFNALMTGKQACKTACFADSEVERAASLLCVTLEDGPRRLKATRDAQQALKLAKMLLASHEMQELKRLVAARQKDMETDMPVLADLSRFKYRAKVELVRWNGRKAVKKTFRDVAKDAMEREVAFHNDIAPYSDVPARILACEGNAIIFEHIDNRFERRQILGLGMPIPLPLAQVRELADFVRLVAERGWDSIDLTPRDNILVESGTSRLRAIDFEFAHRAKGPVDLATAYFLSGVPPDAIAARPLNNAMETDPYPRKWRPFTALSKASFLNDPAWLQAVKRATIHPVWLLFHVTGALRRRWHHKLKRAQILRQIALPPMSGSH